MRLDPWRCSVGFVAGGDESGIVAAKSWIVEWADLNFVLGAMNV
jgi:hypothetical protein